MLELIRRQSQTKRRALRTTTATASGLDIAAEGAGKLGEGKRRLVSEFVVREGFARLSVDGEIIIEPRKPAIVFGDATLRALAEVRPASLADLDGVTGIGAKKREAYGEAVLGVIAAA